MSSRRRRQREQSPHDEQEEQSQDEAPRRGKQAKSLVKTAGRRRNGDDDDGEQQEAEDFIDVANFKDQPIDPNDTGKVVGLAKDWENIQKNIKNVATTLVHDVAMAMAEVAEGDELDQALKELDDIMKELLDVDDEMNAHQEVLTTIAGTIQNQTAGHIVEQYEQGAKARVNQYRLKTTRQKYAKHEQYVEYREHVFEATHPNEAPPPISQILEKEEGDDSDDDDDFEMGGVMQDFKCPLTLQIFKEPVTGPCKHTFSKAAILDYLGTQADRRSGVCPTAGCKQQLFAGVLKPDKSMEKRADAYARRQKKAAENAEEEDEDDDVIE